jgi:arylsulfatase A-like enzyme
VAGEAAKMIREHQPQVMFVHFADVDAQGHGAGWGSEAQVKAAAGADDGIGRIVSALDMCGVLDETTILVTADHGGSGKSHGADDPASRHIPWIIAGPGTLANFDLTGNTNLFINTEDTFATACWILGIPLPEDTDGKPITQAFQDPPAPPVELVRDAKGRM